jgi:catechol 2,3-dioxygenase-like lactoylglutathione lyase family enzyme
MRFSSKVLGAVFCADGLHYPGQVSGARQARRPRVMHAECETEVFMARVVGIDHLVLSVGDFKRSKEFYTKLLGFLGFKLKYEYSDMAGWSNGKTLFWIAAADGQGRKHKYRKGDIGFHHYAFELSSRRDVDELGAFLEKNGMTIVDPPGEYYDRNYYAVYFTDPDGMKLEGMIWAPPEKKRKTLVRKRSKKS